MNIFEVLNQGNSRLHEPSVSAMLGYLLDTRRDHGLGDTFFREFVSLINKEVNDHRFEKYLNRSFIDTDVLLEEPYEFNGSSKYIDIQVSVLNKDEQERRYEDFRFIIENKVNDKSATEGQLDSYYKAIIEDENTIENLAIIYITPYSKRNTLLNEFSNLKLTDDRHIKSWVKWNGESQSVLSILKNVLQKETVGEINPINEYTRHTIKAFIQFLNNIVSSPHDRTIRFGEDIGEIVDSVEVNLNEDGKTYRIIRRDSQQIQIFEGEEKVTAKPILRKIIRNRNLNVPLSGLNTRTMGRKVIDELNQRL
ncbi:MAG: PD-(D/E)XK nuclease family protein [Balneolaceae bacterium]|nr:PD-(D/E)XK nuclease family protein [Balneolaceae bacterium]